MNNTQKSFVLLAVIGSLTFIHEARAQGWMAVIDLDLNHELYAYEEITNVTFTYSGITKTASSSTSNLQLILHGTGSITGDINLSINGTASDPYYSDEPFFEPIAARFSGTFAEFCTRAFFENNGESTLEQVYIWIEVYPRLQIDGFRNDCDMVSFRTNTCSDTFFWEVSENINSGYRLIEEKTGPAITLSREELVCLGFSDPFGRKYFRVTGRPGTTSQIQPVDIYYPPPEGSVSITPPRCHDGADGSITVNITSPNPSAINDFVLTLFPVTPAGPIKQLAVNDGFAGTFQQLAAGTYSMRIENNSKKEIYGACRVDLSIEPLENPAETAIASFHLSDYNGYEVSCNGAADGRIEVNSAGGTGIYTAYQWSPNVSTTEVAENLPEGSYQVKVKDSNGCWSEPRSQQLISPQKLTASLVSIGGKNGFDVSCADKVDGAIESYHSGGVPGYKYLWSNETAGKNLSGVGPGTYQLTITDVNGCATTASTTLYAPEPIDFSVAEISGISCFGASSGFLEVQGVVNALGDLRYAWSTGASGKEIYNLPAGSYSVSVSDGQGCTATNSYTLSEPPKWSVDVVVLSDYNGSPIRCNGDDSAELEAVVRDGQQNIVPAQQYTWYKDGDELISGPELSVITGLSAGLYKAEITYGDFCKLEQAIELDEPEPVIVTIENQTDYNGVAISCHGRADGGILALAEGGTGTSYEYLWANGDSGPQLTALPAGTYSVTARDKNGCAGSVEKILDQPEPLEPVIAIVSDYGGSPVSCAYARDGRLRGSATGGVPPFSYQWNSGQTTNEVWDLPAGLYILTVKDANNCTSDTQRILPDPVPLRADIATASNHQGYSVSCNGGRDGFLLSTASGGTGNYEFLWEQGRHAGPLYENLQAGTYAVIVKDQNGCMDTARALITEPEPLGLKTVAVTNVSCNLGADGALELNATGGVGDYVFSINGEIWLKDKLLTGLAAGTYHPIVMDGNGCKMSITETIAEPLMISIQFADIQPASCGDARGTVSAIISGGTGTYRYEWTNSDQEIISDAARMSNLPSDIFTLKVLDDNFCEATRAVGITSADGPTVKVARIIPPSCHDAADGEAQVIAEGAHPFTFHWQDGQQTAQAVNLRKGEHLVEIKDANDCKVIQSLVVTAPDPVEIELIDRKEPTCSGNCNGQLVVSGKGGTGMYNFVWGTLTGPDVKNLCKGQYEVTLTDEKGCKATKTFSLAEPEPLELKLLSAREPLCANTCDGSISVNASGGTGNLQYQWTNGWDRPELFGLCAGTYDISVTDERNCVTENSFTLTSQPAQALDLGGSLTLCAGQTHVLDPGSFWQKYSWGSDTGIRSAEQSLLISDPGIYWLETTSTMGCVARDTFLLKTSADLLNANFLVASQAMLSDTVVMIDVSWPLPDGIVWTLPSEFKRLHDLGDIVHGKFQKVGDYGIALEATLGQCRDQISKTIRIVDDDALLNEDMSGGGSFIEELTLFPNPNDGAFQVVIKFMEESQLSLTVWNTLTGEKLSHINDNGENSYVKLIDLRPLSAGLYTLRLDYKNGTKYLRFIVR